MSVHSTHAEKLKSWLVFPALTLQMIAELVLEQGQNLYIFSCHMSDVISHLLSFWSYNPCILAQQMDTSHTEVSVVYDILVL